MVSRKAETFSACSEVPGVPQLGHTCLPPPAPRPAHAACPDLRPSKLHNSKQKTRIAFLPKPATKQTQCHFWRAGEREGLSETFLYDGKKSLSQALQQGPSAPIASFPHQKASPSSKTGTTASTGACKEATSRAKRGRGCLYPQAGC